MSIKPFPARSSIIPSRLAVAALLLGAAVLTGCKGSSEKPAADNFPSLLGTSRFNGEPVDTLGANYSLPPDGRHRARLHDTPGQNQVRYTHRSL